ncbi:MAG: hypothetical protein RLZZ02_488, partial [Bacteroidota bacterium]
MNRSKTPIRMRFFATNALRALTIALMVSALASPLHAEVDAELGKKLFKANCASCHKLDKKLVGPALGGVTERRSEAWLLAWIRNNAALRASGDADAIAIFEEYGGSVMTAFENLSDDDIQSILAYTNMPAAAPAPGGKDLVPAPISDVPAEDNTTLLYILGGFLALFTVLLLRIRNTLKE